jgi:hypothetical protein
MEEMTMVRDRIVKLGVRVLGVAIGVTTAATASAAWGPADDRQLTTPTGWFFQGKASDFSGLPSGFRVTDVHVSGTSPLTVSILAVKNTGAYEVDDWGAFIGKTFDEIVAMGPAGRRPIALHSFFSSSGQELFVGATVPNSGATFRRWELLRGDPAQVDAGVPSGFRPQSVATPNQEGVTFSTRPYTVVLVENVENVRWMMDLSITASGGNLNSTVDGVNWGLVDVSPLGNDADQFAAIWYGGGHGGSSIFGATAPAVANLCSSGSFRPIFLADFENFGSGTFGDEIEWSSAMVENF